jgi:hypothetical protein
VIEFPEESIPEHRLAVLRQLTDDERQSVRTIEIWSEVVDGKIR